MINGWKPTQITSWITTMTYKKKWTKPTATQIYIKTMYELDKWIKDDMIASEDIIEKNINNIKKERDEQSKSTGN